MSKKLNKCLEIVDELDTFFQDHECDGNDDLDIICTYLAYQLVNDMITGDDMAHMAVLIEKITHKLNKEKLCFFEENEE